MALQMVHLLTARRWAQAHGEYLNCPEFCLGAISPDAIHVRDHDDKSRKNQFHLGNWTSPHPEQVLDYWKDHCTPFDIGYGIHVLTDAQWVPRFRARLPQVLFPDGRVNTAIYYNDAYVTDFLLYEEEDGAALFDMIERADVPADHPLLTQYELGEWRRQMLECYRGECPKHGTVRYMDCAYVREFIADVQDFLGQVFAQHMDNMKKAGKNTWHC